VGQKFINESCYNKNEMKWRKNHIAESLGTHMLIFGGIDDYGNVLSDTWLLEFVNLRWIKIEPKGYKPPPLAYHSSCFVIAREKLNHQSYSIFKFPDLPLKLGYTNVKFFYNISSLLD
jgi:hypothetical protein